MTFDVIFYLLPPFFFQISNPVGLWSILRNQISGTFAKLPLPEIEISESGIYLPGLGLQIKPFRIKMFEHWRKNHHNLWLMTLPTKDLKIVGQNIFICIGKNCYEGHICFVWHNLCPMRVALKQNKILRFFGSFPKKEREVQLQSQLFSKS